MKKLLFTLSTLFVLSITVSAQKPAPIKFKHGAESAIVTGSFPNSDSKRVYSIKVKRGQNLRVEQYGGGNRKVTIMITNQDGEDFSDMDASCNNNKYIELTDDETYIITVATCGKVDPWRGAFKLKVTAEKAVDVPEAPTNILSIELDRP